MMSTIIEIHSTEQQGDVFQHCRGEIFLKVHRHPATLHPAIMLQRHAPSLASRDRNVGWNFFRDSDESHPSNASTAPGAGNTLSKVNSYAVFSELSSSDIRF